jgi:hypothetical protein
MASYFWAIHLLGPIASTPTPTQIIGRNSSCLSIYLIVDHVAPKVNHAEEGFDNNSYTINYYNARLEYEILRLTLRQVS